MAFTLMSGQIPASFAGGGLPSGTGGASLTGLPPATIMVAAVVGMFLLAIASLLLFRWKKRV